VLREVRLIFPVGEGLSSTGRDSVNQPDDVTALQDALNDLLPNEGGPIDPLAVTGIMDVPTGQAIRRFQKMHFGWQDGVVDPRQKTLQKLNEMRRTPMSPLDTTLNPTPRLVPQNTEFHCWAAGLESWLELTRGRPNRTQEELVEDFKAVEDPATGAMSNPGWSTVAARFRMNGTIFSNEGQFLRPNEINGEFVSDRLTKQGYLVFIYNLRPGGPSHVNVVYGVFEDGKKTFVRVMDPFMQGNGGIQNRPLEFYTRRSGVGMLWAR